ncbi:VOC family protein [Nocardia aurea]|uniref:VOC family protein n=1 Tax=Nocardia aurea TaxID=2144174 RepID=UPI000D68C330|nr:VOC family protein [Nocardia aurea]
MRRLRNGPTTAFTRAGTLSRMTRDIRRIDHTGILSRNLDQLEQRYLALGFTLSPRSRHLLSERPGEKPVLGGTANRCALFGQTYIELLGIVDPAAPDPWRTKEVPDGFRIFYVGSDDVDAQARRLTEAGVPIMGVRSLEREVDTVDGPRAMRARALHVDPRFTPHGYIGIAHQLTPEYLHQPRYLTHPNGARAIASVLVVVDDAELGDTVERYTRILDTSPVARDDRRVLELPAGRLEFVAASRAAETLPGVVPRGLAAMSIAVADVNAARRLVDGNGIATVTTGDGFLVSADDAFGSALFFTAS